MMTAAQKFLTTPPAWLLQPDAEDIVLCTVGRLTRNLPGIPFPGWSTSQDRSAAAERLLPVLRARRGFKTAWQAEMTELDYEARQLLRTQLLISPPMAARQGGCHLIIPQRKNVCFMVNEEEHLAAHFFRRGLDVEGVHDDMARTAEELESAVPFARNRRNGYLASYPIEAGEGMRFYAVLHLPALNMAGTMQQVAAGLEKLHVNLNSVYRTEGNEDSGNLFGMFSLSGPENSTQEIAEYFRRVMQTLTERERQMRCRLSGTPLQDNVGRAYGLLRYAHRLSLRELRDSLSFLRLGTVTGLIRWEEPHAVSMLLGLQFDLTRLTVLSPEHDGYTADAARAEQVRSFFLNHPHTLTFS